MLPPMRALFSALVCAGLGATSADAATHTVTTTTDDGPGSLRAAIAAAADGDEVDFALLLPATITLTSRILSINTSLTINGPGHELLTIRRSPAANTPPFTIARNALGAVTTLRGVSIEGGSGGGYLSFDDLVIENCAFRNNSGPGLAVNIGSARIDGSVFEGNLNGTEEGAGIVAVVGDGETLQVSRTSLHGNEGDGIRIIFGTPTGFLAVSNSTIANNGGAGLDVVGTGGVTIDSSTMAGNVGDLRIDGASTGTPRAFLRSSIFASPAPQFVVVGGASVVSRGHNVSTSLVPAGEGGLIDLTDLSNLDPLLGPLADHGGPSPTMAITSASPAADAGDCDESSILRSTDQRFHPRTEGLACDVGAFEADSAGVVVSTVAEAAGTNCPDGGTRITVGADDGDGGGIADDGVLQDGEVDDTSFACNGSNGSNGSDGTDGTDGADGADGTNGADGTDGANGTDGEQTPCTVIDNDDGTGTLSCPDGTSVDVDLAGGCNGGGGAPVMAVLLLAIGHRRRGTRL